MTDTCVWCKAPVLRLRSQSTGTVVPVDPNPQPGGLIRVDRTRQVCDVIVTATARAAIELVSGPVLHMHHWRTCPTLAAERARRRNGITVAVAR